LHSEKLITYKLRLRINLYHIFAQIKRRYCNFLKIPWNTWNNEIR